ncbi:hypothetical protein Esi_0012_0109 [Ectocarpus siliculosus]|uniref:Uncharacterized protein n=1 Tax=Ectocarpus siliculosus TaxID=2880 RepID=D8LDI9_ECTSI|nr:hypothetical protein Esi_0012_0109 [Ectocarpus siliculosus]|eukprot:CBN74057.1 hypothetical protein Esi_0012_0109 [Ectocarpus siliculosus]
MGLKKAEPSRLKDLLPKKDRSIEADVMSSHIQKLRSFRYQMKNTLAGDNLDTAEELAQKGILSNGELGMSLEHRRDGSMSLTRGLSENGDGVHMAAPDQIKEAFGVPRDLASAIDRLDGPQSMKRSVELMGQCVQVQRSAHGIIMNAMETQQALKTALMEKMRLVGFPVASRPDARGAAAAAAPSLGETPEGGGCHSTAPLNVSGGGGTSGLWPQNQQRKSSPLASPWPSSSLPCPPEGNGGLAAFPGNRKGIGTYAGVASMLQASAQSMNVANPVPTQPPANAPTSTRAAIPGGSANLFSFVPTPPADKNPVDKTAAPSSSNDPATEAAAPSEEAAGAAVTPVAMGASDGGGGPSGGAPREGGGYFGLGLETGDYWETDMLDVGNVAAEALDETSLRMEMQSSMDIHRVMRARQKNQLQLHAQQEQRQGLQEGGGTNADGDVGDAHGATANVAGNSSADGFALPAPRIPPGEDNSSGSTTGSGPTGTAPATNVEADGGPAFGVNSTSGGGATNTAKARTGDGPLPAPPPDNGTAATHGAEALGSGNGMMTSQQYGVSLPRSDGDTPTLMNADWNWDEDKLDAQLFSFLLDTPQSG